MAPLNITGLSTETHFPSVTPMAQQNIQEFNSLTNIFTYVFLQFTELNIFNISMVTKGNATNVVPLITDP